ncbi:MAG: hypothetical protein ACTSO9_04680 [Candidatus Helarchaeota archaeon]
MCAKQINNKKNMRKANNKINYKVDIFRKIGGTIVQPHKTFKSPNLFTSKIYGIFSLLLIATWYSIVCWLMYIKAQVNTHYFLFEGFFWIGYAILTIILLFYFPPFLVRKSFNSDLDPVVSLNVIGLAFGVPNIFIAIVDFTIVVTASNQDITNYALGLGNTAPLAVFSNYVFTIISIWLVLLVIYGVYTISKLSISKSLIVSFTIMAPLLLLLFLFIALESVQPF